MTDWNERFPRAARMLLLGLVLGLCMVGLAARMRFFWASSVSVLVAVLTTIGLDRIAVESGRELLADPASSVEARTRGIDLIASSLYWSDTAFSVLYGHEPDETWPPALVVCLEQKRQDLLVLRHAATEGEWDSRRTSFCVSGEGHTNAGRVRGELLSNRVNGDVLPYFSLNEGGSIGNRETFRLVCRAVAAEHGLMNRVCVVWLQGGVVRLKAIATEQETETFLYETEDMKRALSENTFVRERVLPALREEAL